MMSRRRAWLLLALVPASSVLGLGRAMVETSPDTFVEVWAANFWGDLVFVVGTLLVSNTTFVLMHRTQSRKRAVGLAIPVTFLLHWAVYAASWSLTGPVLFDGSGDFWGLAAVGFPAALRFTFEWGWPGLVAMAALVPAVAARVLWPADSHARTATATPRTPRPPPA